MASESTFGRDPAGLDRLFALGIERLPAGKRPARSLGQLLERPGGWIDAYELLSVLGEGGMGVVYLAQQHRPIRRQVALKILKPGMDSKRVLARFAAEQQALALMDHPHVAHVYDAGLAPSGRPYFVMERVKGQPITAHCDQHRLVIEERLALFLSVCQAVQHAHQKGIIHRDLKPSNILVSTENGRAVPKVIDFGVARAINQPLTERTLYTEQGQLVGTPEYMSPEQADLNSQDVDTRTDVYSLGVLLYELLAGMLPFDRAAFRQGGLDHIRQVICREDPVTPSTRLSKTSAAECVVLAERRRTEIRTLRRQLRGDLDWITLRAMAKEPARRYATVDALSTDIRNVLTHQSVSAAPPTIFYRTGKFIRRHRQGVSVLSLAIVLLCVLFWAVQAQLRTAREHTRFEKFSHEQLLSAAQDAYGNRRYGDALAKVDSLLTSPHVGRKARLLHAQLLLQDQGPRAAVAELEQLVDSRDEVAGQAHFLLANIYYNGDPCAPGGTPEHAARWQYHRGEAEKLIADTASYYFLRAQAAYGVREALDMLAEALQRDRQHYDALRERALIYHSQQDYDKMALDAARMIGIRPDNPRGYALSALALRELGRLDEALEDHNEAIHLAPDDPELYDARRETYWRLGRDDLVLRDAQTCVRLQPRDLPYRHNLSAAYTALGRYDEAQREYAEFLNYRFLREHRLGGVPLYLRGLFYLYAFKSVAESVTADRPWHGPVEPPRTPPFGLMYEAESLYRDLENHGSRLVDKGFHPSWSPSGRKLAYSHGLLMASGVAVLDTKTGDVELLTNSGRNPEWSPDGRRVAFERNRRIWPLDSLAHLNIRTWRPDGWLVKHAEEIWVVDMETREVRHVAEGTCPRWGHQSGLLYYTSRPENVLYSLAIGDEDARPAEILPDCGLAVAISPNERYVADCTPRELRIIDLVSKDIVATWVAPPSPQGGLNVSWSPDCRELGVAGWNGSQIGLWIYDMESSEALKILDGWWMDSRWAPDETKMALGLGGFLEIWQVNLIPGLPTASSFDSVQTMSEHTRSMMELANRWVACDPDFLQCQYLRAQCALWTDDPRADAYLQQFAQALPPYKADDCAAEARWMLKARPQLRERFLPLALLLARKAAEKEPGNATYRELLDEALGHPR